VLRRDHLDTECLTSARSAALKQEPTGRVKDTAEKLVDKVLDAVKTRR
jgi:hypothetical protein